MSQILVYGASTTWGAWDMEGGWVQRLRKYIDGRNLELNPEFEWIVYNLGIDGDDINGVLERFEQETKVRLWPNTETVFIFCIGINDSMFNNQNKQTKLSNERYKEGLEKLINLAKKYSNRIIFVGSFPVDQRVDPIPWLPTHSYKNEYVKIFNEIAEDVFKKNEYHFVDIYHKFTNEDYKSLLIDGVHPNSEGHRKIFEIVKDYISNNKIILL